MTFIIINNLRCRMPLCFIVYLISLSFSLIYSLKEGNIIKDHDLIKVPMLVYSLSTGNNNKRSFEIQGDTPPNTHG
jgi:hypothetical protein